MDAYRISITQFVDSTTSQGIFEFRVEIASVGELKDVPLSYEYVDCGMDEEGRELHVSPWLDLQSALKEVEHVTRELSLRQKTFVVSSNVGSRFVDLLQKQTRIQLK